MSIRSFAVNEIGLSEPIPYIVLWGELMQEAGFTTGKKIIAEVREKGEVVVRIVEE